MHKLIIREGEIERELEFETSELAQLYRDYHLAFGHWNGISKWVEEKSVALESRRFVVDERTELINGEIVRYFKLTDGIELRIEEVTYNSIDEVWKLFRKKRNEFLSLTDWTQVPDSALPIETRKEYRNYRSYLRNLPSLHNDASIVMAKVYSFEDWKKGNR